MCKKRGEQVAFSSSSSCLLSLPSHLGEPLVLLSGLHVSIEAGSISSVDRRLNFWIDEGNPGPQSGRSISELLHIPSRP